MSSSWAPPGHDLGVARSMAHGEQLARIARKFPHSPALVWEDSVRSYADLDGRVSRLAAALARRGLSCGDRLAILMYNSIEMIEAIFAGWRLGAIVVPINFRLVVPEVRFIIDDCSPRMVIADEPLVDSLGGDTLRAGSEVLLVNGDARAGTEALDALLDEPTDAFVAPLVAEADAALICYTSGTTGRPKGAVLTHFNLLMSTMGSMVINGSGRSDEVWYGNLPLFHVGGLTGVLPQILSGGSSVVVPSRGFDAASAVEDLVRYGVTACVFVGAQWGAICDEVGAQRAQLRLRRVSWGTMPTSPEILEKVARTLPGVPMFSFFGQTEMSPVTCVLTAEDAERKRGSIGRPIINVEARLVDDDMHDVAPGTVGEIVYRGPTVMRGYWNMPEATEKAFAGGWFHSGDLCVADSEGYLFVVDRKSDMIVSGGENIYCPEVESAIASHPGVADVAVVGIPHASWGETPLAVIVASDPLDAPSEEEILSWTKERLASYKKPTAVVFVDSLPRNASGKVLKTSLREKYSATSGGG